MTKKHHNLYNLYCFANYDELDFSAIKILRGPLKGSVIEIEQVAFDDSYNPPKLIFKYNYIEAPKKPVKSKKVEKIIGDVIVDIIKHYYNSEN